MSVGERFPDDKRMSDETLDAHQPAVPDEDELKTERAYRQQTGPDEDRHDEPSQQTSPEEERRSPDEEIDEASEESFPASDPPSYSKGLPKTG